jgi:hypothetical protein
MKEGKTPGKGGRNNRVDHGPTGTTFRVVAVVTVIIKLQLDTEYQYFQVALASRNSLNYRSCS